MFYMRNKEKHTSKSKIVLILKQTGKIICLYNITWILQVVVASAFSLFLIFLLANFQLLILLFTRKWYYLNISIHFLRRQIFSIWFTYQI